MYTTYNHNHKPQAYMRHATCEARFLTSCIVHPKHPSANSRALGQLACGSASSCTVPFAYMYNIMACGMGAYSVSSEQIPESENLPWAVTVAVGYILYSTGHTHMQHAATWRTGCSHCLIGDWIRCNRSSSCDCNCGCGAGGRGRGKWSSG